MICPPLDTPEKRAALRLRITNLEIVYDEWVSGKGIKQFEDQNGESISYSPANLSLLKQRILDLTGCLDPSVARAYRARPIGFIFPR